MIRFLTLVLILTISLSSFSQETELNNFKQELDFFINYNLGKVNTLTKNANNFEKLTKAADLAFDKFVLHQNSQNLATFKVSRDDSNIKFSYVNDRIYVSIETFLVKQKNYSVYSYSCGFRKRYLIKDNIKNIIVYKGEVGIMYLDEIHEIDDYHFLIIENIGDQHTSKKALVVSSEKSIWKSLNAFEGKIYKPNDDKQIFINRRLSLLLECNFENTMLAPKESNKISYNENTKTISYKIFENNYKFKVISAKWINNIFIIDDYNVNNYGSHSVSPE